MRTVKLRNTRCAICGTEGHASELYPANFDLQALNPAVFSARRLPDRVHYRLVKCKTCGLVRSDPIADPALLAQLYHESAFTYTDEVADLKRTYGRYLAELDNYGARKGALLEIGCGNGFFLQQALAQGYRSVRGVEPSRAAVSQAAPEVRDSIVCDLMRPGLFAPAQFDVVCMFQVFDHVADPAALLDTCNRLLGPGGLLLLLNHNIDAVSARLLRDRSPIIDIEHTYLYSPRTLSRLLSARGFLVRDILTVRNHYTLQYIARLVPLWPRVKGILLSCLKASAIGRLPVSLPLGNLAAVAQNSGGAAKDPA